MKEFVVIGAGPVGIVISLELVRLGFSVTLIESGFVSYDAEINSAGYFESNNSLTHAPMEIAMRRQFGGTSNIWGGRCVPYDPIDFEKRDFVDFSNWPLEYNDIYPFFARTSFYCKCGDGIFSSANYEIKKSLVDGVSDGDLKLTDLEKWSLPTNFRKEYFHKLATSKNCRIIVGKTLTHLFQESGLVKSCVISDGKKEEIIKGDCFIIAMGTLESTRFLLALQERGIFKNDLIGRFYQGHLSGQISEICFYASSKNINCNVFKNKEGVYVRQRFTFSFEFLKANKLLNISFWTVNPKIGDPNHGNGVLSFAFLALISPFGRYFAPEAIRLASIEGAPKNYLVPHLKNIIFQILSVIIFVITFGYQRFIVKRKIPSFYQNSKTNRYPLHYHSEQNPAKDSCILLGKKTDQYGITRLNIDFKYCDKDFDSVLRAHILLDHKLREKNIGHLEFYKGNLVEQIKKQANDGFHQVGTLRMGTNPSNGVTDKNCLIFGFKNLYTVNGGVLPTSSQANTTFMTVLLGIRLVEHLACPQLMKDSDGN